MNQHSFQHVLCLLKSYVVRSPQFYLIAVTLKTFYEESCISCSIWEPG